MPLRQARCHTETVDQGVVQHAAKKIEKQHGCSKPGLARAGDLVASCEPTGVPGKSSRRGKRRSPLLVGLDFDLHAVPSREKGRTRETFRYRRSRRQEDRALNPVNPPHDGGAQLTSTPRRVAGHHIRLKRMHGAHTEKKRRSGEGAGAPRATSAHHKGPQSEAERVACHHHRHQDAARQGYPHHDQAQREPGQKRWRLRPPAPHAAPGPGGRRVPRRGTPKGASHSPKIAAIALNKFNGARKFYVARAPQSAIKMLV